jgi:hypothetical protein
MSSAGSVGNQQIRSFGSKWNRRSPRFCIFCGRPGNPRLSREHVWPDWLKDYIPKIMTGYTSLSATIHERYSEPRREKGSGDLRSRRLRVVCEDCNTGWMSRLQENTKPHLLPLIHGQSASLTADVQTLVAAWIGMFTIVAEHFDLDRVSTTPAQRRYVMHLKRPPNNWRIYIANHQRGAWVGQLIHFAVPVASGDRAVEFLPSGLPRPNTQSMSFTVGRLYVHVRSSVLDIFAKGHLKLEQGDLLNRSELFEHVWPVRQSTVCWPPTSILSDAGANEVANFFQSISDRVAEQMMTESLLHESAGRIRQPL